MVYDPERAQRTNATGLWRASFEITPNDNEDLEQISRGLWVGSDGNLRVTLEFDEDSRLFENVEGFLPIAVRRVHDTDTTANNIIGGY